MTTPHDLPTQPPAASAFGNEPTARARLWRFATIIVAMLVPLAFWGWAAIETHAKALDTALADERRVTEALGEHTLKLLEAQAFALNLLDREAGQRDCPALRADPHIQNLLKLTADSPQMRSVWLIDADGFLCIAANPALMDTKSRAFRDYFNGARDAPPGHLFVDRALVGMASSAPSFDVAEARRNNGTFNGVIVSAVNLSALVHYWKKVIDAQPTQHIALFRDDGATIARSWDPLVPQANPVAERRAAAVWHTAPDGTTLDDSAIDGADRLGAWHSLPGWGVVVVTSLERDEVLALWRRSTIIYGCVALLVSALLGTLIWSLLRDRRVLERTVRERTGALRTSEDKLALFVDRAPAAIAMFDADMRYLAVSRRYLKDYALDSDGPEALLSRSHYDVFPSVPDNWREIHRRVLGGETLSADEDPFPREDGRIDWVRWEMAPWYGSGSRPAGAVLFSEVVTARKTAEEALRESEARFRGLVNAACYVIYRMGPDWTEMRRLDGGGFLSDTISPSRAWLSEYIPPDEQPRVWEAIQRAISMKGVFELEHRVRVADGSQGWTLSRAIPVLNAHGEILEWFGSASDVTPRKRAEEALRESEARFRAAVQAVSGILWTNNPQGEMAGEQPGWAALTGQTRAEYQGYGWAKAVHPDDAGPTIDAWHVAVAERKPFVFEHRVRRHDGVWRRFAIRAIPALHDDGSIAEWVGVHTDVTEQREAEAELAELNRMLEERVRAEVAAREDAQARAVHAQRMQALGQLAGGIAHDFNNILQAVQGAAGLIERRAADPVSVKRFARTVSDASERGAAVTRRLLAFARRSDLRAEPIEAAALLDGLRDVLAQTLGSPISVHVKGASAAAVLADRGQLETVLVNLATNARDAMPDGGTLTLCAEAEEVAAGREHPAGLSPGRYVRLSVTDTGTGMEHAVLERAAEPFFTTKPQDKGTGLGLSMAKGFAEQSGGALAIDSAPGQGTAVTLWLPVADSNGPTAQARQGPPSGSGTARQVLLVDDEDLIREMLVASLEDAGFSVLGAASGAEALALLDSEEAVDVLVSDLSMPGMGGLVVIREAQLRRPGLPAVLLTGYAGDAAHLAVSDPARAGFSLLRKPVSVAQLVDRIDMLVGGKDRDT